MKSKVGIVASLFNQEYVDGMLESVQASLTDYQVHLVRVPGAFEIPLAAQRLIRKQKVEAVIALGLIWKGKTMHAELLAHSVTHALMQISLQEDVPVVHQVLSVESEEEAQARCFGQELNRGREAAEAVKLLLKKGKELYE